MFLCSSSVFLVKGGSVISNKDKKITIKRSMENLAFTIYIPFCCRTYAFCVLLGSVLAFLTRSEISKEAIYACALQRFKNHFEMCWNQGQYKTQKLLKGSLWNPSFSEEQVMIAWGLWREEHEVHRLFFPTFIVSIFCLFLHQTCPPGALWLALFPSSVAEPLLLQEYCDLITHSWCFIFFRITGKWDLCLGYLFFFSTLFPFLILMVVFYCLLDYVFSRSHVCMSAKMCL